eukprot:1782045-Ditylum_brightwellii.AAC.1
MMHKRGQQVLVNIDVNNPSGWGYRHTTSMQQIKAVVVSSSNTMHTDGSLIIHSNFLRSSPKKEMKQE